MVGCSLPLGFTSSDVFVSCFVVVDFVLEHFVVEVIHDVSISPYNSSL